MQTIRNSLNICPISSIIRWLISHSKLIAQTCAIVFVSIDNVSAQHDPHILIARPLGGASSFNETYDNSKVGTGVLLGYRIGNITDFGHLDTMFIGLSDTRLEAVCVSIKTRDARYSALNKYSWKFSIEGFSRIQIHPVTHKYRRELEKYKNTDFAVNAFLPIGDKCSQTDAIHLPQIGIRNFGETKLQILINSETRSGTIEFDHRSVNAASQDAANTKARCTTPKDGAGVAFDRLCELKIPVGLDGQTVGVKITLNDGFELEPYHFKIHIPDFSREQ